MRLKDVKVGFAMTGSHCTIKEIMDQLKLFVKEGADVTPIISDSLDTVDTRFGTAAELKKQLQDITGKIPVKPIAAAEPIGPNKLFDIVVVAPCTGNTLAKLAGGITDTPVLMAIKAHLRNQRPVVLSIATNDGLGMNAKNIGLLINTKNIYMVPFGQDNPNAKANSLVAKIEFLADTTVEALRGKQLQPVLVIY